MSLVLHNLVQGARIQRSLTSTGRFSMPLGSMMTYTDHDIIKDGKLVTDNLLSTKYFAN